VPPPIDSYPYEEPEGYHEMDHLPDEQVAHNQVEFIEQQHDYQEKDLARIVVNSGDMIISPEDDEEGKVTVADFIYSNIHVVFDFFDNDMCKRVIQEGFNYINSEDTSLGIRNFFINHSDKELSSFAVDRISSPYELADWERIGVYLNQKMPEKNYLDDSMQAVLRFKLKKISKVLDVMKKRINSETDNEELKIRLLKAFKKLQQEKRELALNLGNVIS